MKLNKKFVYAKYIFAEAKRHKGFRGPASQGIAINLLHDAAEIAMIAIAEDLDIKDRHNGLIDLIKKVDSNESKKIGHSKFLSILNALRNNFKHNAVLPSKEQLIEVVTLGLLFFEDISVTYYDARFSNISLVSLIENNEIREHINKAEEFYGNARYEDAVLECTLAKGKLNLSEDVGTKVEHLFPMARRWKNLKSTSSLEGHLAALIEDTSRSFREIYKQFYLFHLGVDFKEYEQFLSLLPGLTMSPYTKAHQFQIGPGWKSKINEETSRFLIDFFTEFVLKIQEG